MPAHLLTSDMRHVEYHAAQKQKDDDAGKQVRKNDSSSQPLLDEDDGSAYDASTL